MTNIRKPGVLLPFISDFIKMRHNLGYKSINMEKSLKAFDVFAREQGLDKVTVLKELAQQWCEKRNGEAYNTWSLRTSNLRQFSIYLFNLGYSTFIPNRPPAKKNCTFTPYLYSQEEIKRIFEATDHLALHNNFANNVLMTIPLLIRMLYATGIRIGEAVNLNLEDVNIEKDYLIVKGSKNGKDRTVPFSKSLAACCHQYLNYRNKLPRHSNRFFVKLDGSQCQASAYKKWWNKVLCAAGIQHRGKMYGPRIHDLRHVFCIRSMHQMSMEGKDLYYFLPILSTYVGHQSLAATDKYIRMTSEMYPELTNKLDGICSYIFPNIKNR